MHLIEHCPKNHHHCVSCTLDNHAGRDSTALKTHAIKGIAEIYHRPAGCTLAICAAIDATIPPTHLLQEIARLNHQCLRSNRTRRPQTENTPFLTAAKPRLHPPVKIPSPEPRGKGPIRDEGRPSSGGSNPSGYHARRSDAPAKKGQGRRFQDPNLRRSDRVLFEAWRAWNCRRA